MTPVASPEQAQPAFALDPEGKLVQLPPGQEEQARAQGFLPLSDDQAHKVDVQQRFGGQYAKTAAVNAVTGALPFGIGAKLVEAAGVPGEEAQGLSEANPSVAAGFHLAGMGLPLLVPGAGEAEVAEGLSGAGRALLGASPSSLISRAGEAGAGAARALAGDGVLGQALGGAARGAIEAPLYTLGDQLTENVFDDKQLTGEQLLSAAGTGLTGALTGGVLEGALGIGEQYGPRLFDRTSKALDSLEQRLTPADAPDHIPGVEVPAEPLIPQGPAGVPAPAPRVAPAPFSPAKEIDTEEAQRVFRGHLANAYDGVQDQLSDFNSAAKPARVVDLIGNQPAKPEVAKIVQEARAVLNSSASSGPAYERAQDLIDKLQARVGSADNLAEQQLALDAGKRGVDKVLKWAKTAQELTPEQQAALLPLRDVASKWRSALEDERLFGEAAPFQAKVNSAQARYFDAEDGFKKAFLRKGATDTEGRLAVDAKKVATFVKGRDAGMAANDDRELFLRNYTSAAKDLTSTLQDTTYSKITQATPQLGNVRALLDQASTSGDAAAQSLTQQAGILAANKAGQRGYERAILAHERAVREDARAYAADIKTAQRSQAKAVTQTQRDYDRQLGAAEKRSGQLRKEVLGEWKAQQKEASKPGVLGELLHDVPVVGSAFRLLSRQGEVLSKVARAASKVTGRLSAGFTDALEAGGARKAADFAASLEGHAERLDSARQREADQDAQIDHLSALTRNLAPHAPQLANAVQMTTQAKEQFLLQAAPKDPRAPNPMAPPAKYVPSPAEQARYERVERAVMHPESLVVDLKAGRVSPEAIAAVRATSPALYSQMVGELQQRIADRVASGKAIAPAQQTQIDIFMGQAVSQGMQMSGRQQAMFAASPAAPPTSASGTGRTRVTGLANLDGASRAAPPSAQESS